MSIYFVARVNIVSWPYPCSSSTVPHHLNVMMEGRNSKPITAINHNVRAQRNTYDPSTQINQCQANFHILQSTSTPSSPSSSPRSRNSSTKSSNTSQTRLRSSTPPKTSSRTVCNASIVDQKRPAVRSRNYTQAGRCIRDETAWLIRIGSNVLVPLTNSLYVKGELTSTDKVLVDVGTGFLIEKVRVICVLL